MKITLTIEGAEPIEIDTTPVQALAGRRHRSHRDHGVLCSDTPRSITIEQRRAMFGLLTKFNGDEPLDDGQRYILAKTWTGTGSWAELSEQQASTILAGLFSIDYALNGSVVR